MLRGRRLWRKSRNMYYGSTSKCAIHVHRTRSYRRSLLVGLRKIASNKSRASLWLLLLCVFLWPTRGTIAGKTKVPYRVTSPPLTCTDTTADNPVATRLTSFSSSPPPSRPFLPSSGPRAHETGHSARVGRGVSTQSQVSRRARAHKQQGTPLSTCKHAILLEATTPRSAAGTIPATSPHLYDAPWRRQAWRDNLQALSSVSSPFRWD